MARLKVTKDPNKIEIVGLTPTITPEPEPVIVTDDDLKKFIISTCPVTKDEFIRKNTTNNTEIDVNSLMYFSRTFINGANSFQSCCGVIEKPLSIIQSLITNNHDSYRFGRVLHYIFGQAWNYYNPDGYYKGYITRLGSTPDIGTYLTNYILCSGYIFTWASHQPSEVKEYLVKLGAEAIDIGVNAKYPAGSNHNIEIMLISLKTSLGNFINQNRDRLIADYIKAR